MEDSAETPGAAWMCSLDQHRIQEIPHNIRVGKMIRIPSHGEEWGGGR